MLGLDSMICPNCGQEIPNKSKFCMFCGTPITDKNWFIPAQPEDTDPKDYEVYDANLKNPKKGAEIRFGHYSNGQSIIWKILKIKDNMLLIISSNSIGKMHYHDSLDDNVIWADCKMRNWLNNDFLNGYFSPEEQSKIVSSKIRNVKNPDFDTPGGITTTDKVFLLSIKEAEQYFANDEARSTGSSWWLRSPGCDLDVAAYVYEDGWIDTHGDGTNMPYDIRPALWLKMD